MGRLAIAVAVAAVAFSSGRMARAASFDCKLAKTPVEKAVCASPQLSRLDEAMSVAYKQRLAAAAETERPSIRAGQRAWLKSLPVNCKGEISALTACLLTQYGDRRTALEASTAHDPRFSTHEITLQTKDSPDYKAAGDLEERAGYGTLHVKWPEAKTVSPDWQAWNIAVRKAMQDFLTPEDDKTPPRRNAAGWDQRSAADVDGDAAATVSYTSDWLVSTHFEVDMMGHGAAHPSEQSENFHWLLKERRRLKTDDVFKPGSGWQAFLVKRTRQGLLAQEDAENRLYDAETVTKALHDVTPLPDCWELDESSLTIDFPEYTVAPRVSMADPVSIPWKELRPYLAPGFVPPR